MSNTQENRIEELLIALNGWFNSENISEAKTIIRKDENGVEFIAETYPELKKRTINKILKELYFENNGVNFIEHDN